MATIRKLRRDTYATLLGVTGSEDEIGYASDKGRVVFFDGVTAGPSFILPTVTDILLNNFTVAVCSGTDTLTASLLRAPAAYAAYMQVLIIPANDNTGAVTLNLNSLGAKAVKKMGLAGLVDLDGGDFKAGGAYPAVYDGTRFIAFGGGLGASGGMAQPLSTSNFSAAASVDFSNLLDSTYDTYIIRGENVAHSTSLDVGVRAGYGGSPTYISASYTNGQTLQNSTGGQSLNNNTGNTAFWLTGGSNLDTNGPSLWEFTISNANATSTRKAAHWRGATSAGSGNSLHWIGGGTAGDTNLINNALTSLRLVTSSGTITGSATLYGLRRAA